MFRHEPLGTQLEAVSGDPVRTLIVGAGVAGASLAALQRRRGRHPVLIDRAEANAPDGYMLGLLPLAGNLLHTLDRYEHYLDASAAVGAYEVGDGKSRLVRHFKFGDFFEANGAYRGIERGALLDVVSGGGAVSWKTTVTAIRQSQDVATITFADGTGRHHAADFDVVVVADGLHSTTRGLVQPSGDLSTWDTGWGGWVVWASLGDQRQDTYTEYWAAGSFVGFYPVPDRVGIFVGGPASKTAAGPRAFAEELRARGPLGPRIETALGALTADPHPFFWHFADCRGSRFVYGRSVLLGDSGAGFLPTAGVGAAMAMDSAAALDDELSRTGREHVPFALELYERRQRPRVLAAHRDSRRLARIMFTESRTVSWLTRKLVGMVSLRAALGGIRKVIERR